MVHRREPDSTGRPDHWHFLQESRYFPDISQAPRDSTVLDLRRKDQNWRALADFPDLEEVTGQGLTHEQIEFVAQLPGLKRLRLLGLRSLDLSALGPARKLEELALMSISGPQSLKPLLQLNNLRSLYVESAPKLVDYSALSQANGIRCLCITSASEKAQDIVDLSFLSGMTALQHLMLGFVRYLRKGLIFEGLEGLADLRALVIYPAFVPLSDRVYLQVRFSHIDGVEQQNFVVQGMGERDLPLHKLDTASLEEVFTVYFAGKGERAFTGPASKVKERIERFQVRVDEMRRVHRLEKSG